MDEHADDDFVTWGDLREKVARPLNKIWWMTKGMVIILIITSGIAAYLIHENKVRSQDIQTQRYQSMLANCEQTNDRNLNTTKALDAKLTALEGRPGVTQAQIDQIKQSRDFTVQLINSLAPVRDCTQLSLEPTAVGPAEPVPTEPTTTSKHTKASGAHS